MSRSSKRDHPGGSEKEGPRLLIMVLRLAPSLSVSEPESSETAPAGVADSPPRDEMDDRARLLHIDSPDGRYSSSSLSMAMNGARGMMPGSLDAVVHSSVMHTAHIVPVSEMTACRPARLAGSGRSGAQSHTKKMHLHKRGRGERRGRGRREREPRRTAR